MDTDCIAGEKWQPGKGGEPYFIGGTACEVYAEDSEFSL